MTLDQLQMRALLSIDRGQPLTEVFDAFVADVNTHQPSLLRGRAMFVMLSRESETSSPDALRRWIAGWNG